MDALRGKFDLSGFPLTGAFLAGRTRHRLGNEELEYIEGLVGAVEDHADGTCLVRKGRPVERSTILVDGYAFRTIESEGRRYVVGVHVPGDFLDLHGFTLKRLDHSLVAVGDVTVGYVAHAALSETVDSRPGVARALWFATMLDAAIHRKWIHTLGQLDAPRRIAHIYAELHTRLSLVDHETDGVLRTPFTQQDLADMCGVSAIHANRAVGKLRETGIAEIRRGDLYTDDWARLKQFAQFDPSYLYADAGGD